MTVSHHVHADGVPVRRNSATLTESLLVNNKVDHFPSDVETPRRRAREFRRFLALIDELVPGDLAVHVVLDNVATRRIAEM